MTGSSLLFKNAMVQESVTRRSAEALSEVTLMGMSAAVTRLIAAAAAAAAADADADADAV